MMRLQATHPVTADFFVFQLVARFTYNTAGCLNDVQGTKPVAKTTLSLSELCFPALALM